MNENYNSWGPIGKDIVPSRYWQIYFKERCHGVWKNDGQNEGGNENSEGGLCGTGLGSILRPCNTKKPGRMLLFL